MKSCFFFLLKGLVLLCSLGALALLTGLEEGLPLSEAFHPLTGLLFLISLGSYLLGSIPFGLILVRLGGQGDVRTIGSGNIGATNVLRSGHKGLAAGTLLLDALKGLVCVVCVRSSFVRELLESALAYDGFLPFEAYEGIGPGRAGSVLSLGLDLGQGSAFLMRLEFLAATSVLMGHLYPLWLHYRGGKGIATLAGALLGLSWTSWLSALVLWGGVFWKTRISSLAAIAALILTPVASFLMGNTPLGFWLVPISGLLLWRHKDNIWRLRKGVES